MERPYQPSYRSCTRAASCSEEKEVREVLAEVEQKISALSRIIGNTPLLGIHFAYRGQQHVIYAKSEQVNMTGSIKDRMALHILKEAYAADEFDRATPLQKPPAATPASRLQPSAARSGI